MLTSRIPRREEIDASREEAGFEDAEKNAETEESGPIWDETECLDRCYGLTFWDSRRNGSQS